MYRREEQTTAKWWLDGIIRSTSSGRFEVKMLAEKLESGLAVDGVTTVEIFDRGLLIESKVIVETLHVGVFEGHALIHACAVFVPSFHHEGSRCHQVRQLGVADYICEVKFIKIVTVIEHETGRVHPGHTPHGVVEVSRADGEGETLKDRRH